MKRILIIYIIFIFSLSLNSYLYNPKISNNENIEFRDTLILKIIYDSNKYIGKKYKLGSNGPNKFDCSGFIQFLFKDKGIILPRTSYKQYIENKENNILINYAEAGDLIFFKGSKTRNVGHVGMIVYSNNDTIKFIHASNTGIKISSLTESYYKRKYVGILRIVI